MDALTSMATIAGYKAVVIGADKLPRIFPMLTTAAGTITPARVLVIGAGVAGLQAIATGRTTAGPSPPRMICARPRRNRSKAWGSGSVELAVEAKKTPQDARGYAAHAGTMRSMERQRQLLGKVVAESDVVITAAVIPGKKSPVLVTAEMVAKMAPGSVIVDLAAERGGNCALTHPGSSLVVIKNGVTIVGWLNLASTVPYHASQMYARNVTAFMLHLVKDGQLRMDLSDEIIRETLLTLAGEVVNPRVREFFVLPPLPAGPKKDQ